MPIFSKKFCLYKKCLCRCLLVCLASPGWPVLCSVAGEQCGNSRQCVACYVSGPGHRITGCSQLSLNNVTTLNTYWTYCHCHTTRLGPVCTPVPGQPWSPQLVKQRKLETGDRQRGRRVRGGSFTWYTPLYYDTPHMICSTTVWHTTLLPWRPGNSLRMWGSVWDQWEHFALSHETKRGKVWMTGKEYVRSYGYEIPFT